MPNCLLTWSCPDLFKINLQPRFLLSNFYNLGIQMLLPRFQITWAGVFQISLSLSLSKFQIAGTLSLVFSFLLIGDLAHSIHFSFHYFLLTWDDERSLLYLFFSPIIWLCSYVSRFRFSFSCSKIKILSGLSGINA